MTLEEARNILDAHVSQLKEHFDAVQLMVSWETDDGNATTSCVKRGGGNWWARQGMAHDFINTDTADTLGTTIAEKLKEQQQ